MHDLHAAKDDACATERFESEHRSDDALDRPVVLLNEVVEILAPPKRYRRDMLDVIAFDARGIGAVLVDRDDLRKTVALDGLSQKALCRSPIALSGEHEVNGVARFVHRAIEILPFGRRP